MQNTNRGRLGGGGGGHWYTTTFSDKQKHTNVHKKEATEES